MLSNIRAINMLSLILKLIIQAIGFSLNSSTITSSTISSDFLAQLPLVQQQLVKAKISFIAGSKYMRFADSVRHDFILVFIMFFF